MSRWNKTDIVLPNPVEDSPDFEREMVLTINWIPGYPAKTSGPPEECYPGADLEFEILSAKYGDGREVPQEVLEALDEDTIISQLEVYSDNS